LHQLEPISEESWSKIEIGWHYQFWPRYNQLKATEPKPWNERTIDVFFAGTTTYGRTDIQWHRERLIEQLEKLKKSFRVLVCRHRGWLFPEYCKHLANSKIVVAPWGYGERTHREVEGWLAGCSVIRPNTNWMRSWPDMEEDAYHACEPDFRDLEESVESVLSTGTFHGVSSRNYCRKEILDCSDNQKFAERFKGIVERSLERAKATA
jgi:hypothetical protein